MSGWRSLYVQTERPVPEGTSRSMRRDRTAGLQGGASTGYCFAPAASDALLEAAASPALLAAAASAALLTRQPTSPSPSPQPEFSADLPVAESAELDEFAELADLAEFAESAASLSSADFAASPVRRVRRLAPIAEPPTSPSPNSQPGWPTCAESSLAGRDSRLRRRRIRSWLADLLAAESAALDETAALAASVASPGSRRGRWSPPGRPRRPSARREFASAR